MATPTLGSVPTTIDNADATTGWTLLATQDLEFKKEGAAANSGILRNDLAVGYYDIIVDGGSAQNMTGRHVRIWINFTAIGFLDIEANGGIEFYMYDGTNTAYWVAFGSDTYFGGWKNFLLDCDRSPESGSFNKASVQRWGLRFNRTAAPANRINTWVDFLRWGDGYYATGGGSGDEIDLAGIRALDNAAAYGIIDLSEGVYLCAGALTLGNGATTTWFEMLGEVLVWVDAKVAAGMYKLVGAGSGCRVNIQDSVLRSSGAGDNTRFIVDMDDADLVSCAINGSFFRRAGECRFKAGQDISGNVFDNCGQILAAGADFTGCVVKGYAGTADTAALVWNVNADPDGELDDMTFEKGSASAHAIQLGASSPSEVTLRGMTFSGYSASHEQQDSVILLADTGSDRAWTINAVSCSGTVSVKKTRAGDTYTVVVDPVTLLVHAQDAVTSLDVASARVLVEVASGVGGWPYQESVTISQTGGVATVAHTAHGLSTNDWVVIRGASPDAYNGVKQITKINDNSYSFSIASGTSSPATGTITSTLAIIHGTTDANGDISASRSYDANQPILGRARRATSGLALYKTAPITGEIDSVNGLTVTVQMIGDG